MDKEYDIFISYRRVDSEGKTSGRDIARTIKLELEKREYNVFFDYSEIKDDDFEKIILSAVRNSKVFIILLSKDTLLRCTNEKDWVRREIETAIEVGCKLIPVNPEPVFSGWPKDLPESLEMLTKQEISDVATGSLFEKSIDKLEEERLFKVLKQERIYDTAVANRLSTYSFIILYLIIGGFCCFLCTKSFVYTIYLPQITIWPISIAFFIIFSLCAKAISDSMNPKSKIQNRMRRYFIGVACAIIYGITMIIPCMTHALYYDFNIEEQIQIDLATTKGYLVTLANGQTKGIYVSEIAKLNSLERKLAIGALAPNKKEDALLVDSILKEGYDIISKCGSVKYKNLNDEFYYTQTNLHTHIETMMSMANLWKKQFQNGFSINFIIMLIISIILCSSAILFFIKAMSNETHQFDVSKHSKK